MVENPLLLDTLFSAGFRDFILSCSPLLVWLLFLKLLVWNFIQVVPIDCGCPPKVLSYALFSSSLVYSRMSNLLWFYHLTWVGFSCQCMNLNSACTKESPLSFLLKPSPPPNFSSHCQVHHPPPCHPGLPQLCPHSPIYLIHCQRWSFLYSHLSCTSTAFRS